MTKKRPTATVTRENDLRLKVIYSDEEGATIYNFKDMADLMDFHLDKLLPKLRKHYDVVLEDKRVVL